MNEIPELNQVEELITSILRGERGLSFSSLKNFKKSPTDFINYMFRRIEATPAMLYGQMLHCSILEPDQFNERYWVLNDAAEVLRIGGGNPRATKEYKEWRLAERDKKGDRQEVSYEDLVHSQIIGRNVRNNRASRRLILGLKQTEKKIAWEYKNFKFTGFIDGEGDDYRIDIKTVPDAKVDPVSRKIIHEDFYLQGAMYNYGSGSPKKHFIIAVDKEGGISIHEITQPLLMYGMDQYSQLMNKFNECILSDGWNDSYDFWSTRRDGIFNAEKPKWLY